MKITKTILKKILKFLFIVILYLGYIKISNLGTSKWASLSQLLDGTARRPFIYRILLPQGARLLAKITPFSISPQHLQPHIFRETFFYLDGSSHPKEAFFVLIFVFFAMLGFVYIEKKFLSDLGFSKETQNILPILLLILSLPLTVHFGYIYDMPQLFLFAALLWLLFRRQWMWYLLLLFITTLNKETSVFLIVFYMIYFYTRLERKFFFKLLFGQLFLYIVVRISLLWIYRENLGDIIYPTLLIHIEQYKSQPILFMLTIVLFLSVFFLIREKWAKKNIFLKSAIIIPLLILPLYFIGGMPMEFRVFLEASPILGMLIFDPEKL